MLWCEQAKALGINEKNARYDVTNRRQPQPSPERFFSIARLGDIKWLSTFAAGSHERSLQYLNVGIISSSHQDINPSLKICNDAKDLFECFRSSVSIQ